MSLRRDFIKLLVVLSFGACWALGKEPAANPLDTHGLYPFEVTVAGEAAKMKNKGDLFAVLDKPVKSDALLTIKEKSALLIVNAHRCNPDGSVPNGGHTHAMFAQNTNEVKMDATLDKKKLEPGLYLMNVVAHSKTSRVVFKVEDPKKKTKMPTIKQVMDFLRGKK